MEIKNLQTFILGEGSLSKDVFLTLDLIPIQVVFKYDKEIREYEFYGGKAGIAEIPDYIDKIYTVDIYGELICKLCNVLELPERGLECFTAGELPEFNFRKDDTFYEFQYYGTFGRTYYTPTKLSNALKMWEQWKHLMQTDEYGRRILSDGAPMMNHFADVWEGIKRQGVFTSRDYIEITNTTLDKFINNLKRKQRFNLKMRYYERLKRKKHKGNKNLF